MYSLLRSFLIFMIFSFNTHYSIADNGGDCIIIEILKPIQNGANDVEERTDGSIYSNSTDIELVHDYDDGDQIIGLRFLGLQIPQGAEILEAYIQFTTDNETSSGAINLNISGENTDNASLFEEVDFNISSREKTINQINWQPANWTIESEVSDDQKTPDLSPIVQEIVNRNGWQSGNSINFIIEGTGRRVAAAYELNPNQAAQLYLKFGIPDPDTLYQGLIINEAMSTNGLVQDEFGETDDWVEIYNASDQPVFLGGLFLTDNLNNLKKWEITAPILLMPGQFEILWLDGTPNQGGTHANFKLSSSGEFLAISQEYDDEMHILDAAEFPNMPVNVSYGRIEDGASEWVLFGEFSPKSTNNGQLRYLNESVIFSEEGGLYEDFVTLTMSVSDPDATIYYTIDGSTPTTDDLIYNMPIFIGQTKIIRACALKTGYSHSPVTTETYIIDDIENIGVLCVNSEPENFWDDEIGIYPEGTNGTDGYCVNEPRNWNQDWERPGNIAFYEPDGEKAFQVNVGIKIGGGCSRSLKMKSLNFFCRNGTYGDESIDYQIFPGLDIHQFKRIKVRNSGNDFEQMLFRDATNQAVLANQVDLDLMAYRPVRVYLNGEYWGVYGLREFFNEDYLASHHGVDPENVDLISNPSVPWHEVKDGDYEAFESLTNFVAANNLSDENNFQTVENVIDVNEYINYHISQIYLGNYDWPANNVRVWRDRNNGKFRWMLFDTDATTNYGWWSNSLASDNTLAHAIATNGNAWPNGPESTLLLRKLLQNQEFKNEFVQRTCTFRELIFVSYRVNPIVDSLSNMLQPEMQRHINRWQGNWDLGGGNASGGSMNSWYDFIGNYKSFFNNRRSAILNHYQNTLSLDETFVLYFNYNENTKGDLFIHQNEMKVPYEYQGQYFKNIPIKIKAVAKSGYRFSHWLETGETSPEIEFSANGNSTLTPIFASNFPIITEIHYNPKEGDEYEFIEFFNPTLETISFDGVRFLKGIEFEFPAEITLQPNDYLLVVKDKSKYDFLTCQILEWDSGTLSNEGETIEVSDNQGVIFQSIPYQSLFGWPAAANGMGPSLSLKSPELDNSIAQSWEASMVEKGNPCDEEFPSEEPMHEFLLELFPNPVSENLFINYAIASEIPMILDFYNMLGQQVFSLNLDMPNALKQQIKIPVKDWTRGVYQVVLRDEERELWVERFVKD